MRRQHRLRIIRTCCYFVALILLIVTLAYVQRLIGDRNDEDAPEDEPLPKLNVAPGEVPVVIVDEHQDVIPWWYKGVEEGLLKPYGNTLIHIDAHSDMANPEDIDLIMSFKHIHNSRPSSFLPLMESNDVFIISSILNGLINKVIWIRPNWKDDSDQLILVKCYAGYTLNVYTNERDTCVCQRGRNRTVHWLPFECYQVTQETGSNETQWENIPQSTCNKVRSYIFIVLSEDMVGKHLQLVNIKSAIIDIDEDYFGVESGVHNFIQKGVREITQIHLDKFFKNNYCPKTIKAEHILNHKLQVVFSYFSSMQEEEKNNALNMSILEKLLFKETRRYTCKSPLTEDTIDDLLGILSSINVKEMTALSKLNFCLYNKPRPRKVNEGFAVCHGYIFPNETLNQIYVDTIDGIKNRGQRLNKVLRYLIKYTGLKFVTIARSLRDGYTPRDQQRFIEGVVVQTLRNAMQQFKKYPRIIYDKQLFGKNGWSAPS